MPLIDDVSNQMKDAMRAKDQARTLALRSIRAGFITAMKEDGKDTLSDEACIEVLRRIAKQRQDSIDAYVSANRPDMADAERAELVVINAFLPQLADEATTRAWVAEAIAATKASSVKEVGKVMGAVMKAHKGDVDGALVKRLAEALLAG
jgi:uncharacterized protein YqeY